MAGRPERSARPSSKPKGRAREGATHGILSIVDENIPVVVSRIVSKLVTSFTWSYLGSAVFRCTGRRACQRTKASRE